MKATPTADWQSTWARAGMVILKAPPRLCLAAEKERKAEMKNANKIGSQIHWSEKMVLRIWINMIWECGLRESGVGYGPVAGTYEHGNEISCPISGVEFPDQRLITFQDCVHRREYSSVYFVYAFCGRKAQAASDESLRPFPSPHHRSTVLRGRISICHTAIFVTVWRTTGSLSTKNRQWQRVYNSSRESLLNRPPMKKPRMQVWRTSHQDLLYLITASAYNCCNLAMRQLEQMAVVAPWNSIGYENTVCFVIKNYARWHNQVPQPSRMVPQYFSRFQGKQRPAPLFDDRVARSSVCGFVLDKRS